jgi:hypothetical protein
MTTTAAATATDERVDAAASVGADEQGASEAGREGNGGGGDERRVPVGEAIRYRKRAQEAEGRAGTLEARVRELEETLASARETMDSLERRHEIDLTLMRAEAVDLETSRLLTELTVAEMDEPDVGAAVAELRRRKPFLFRKNAGDRPGSVSAAMSGRARQAGVVDRLEDAADVAARTGDRGALLRYLRARRGG